MSKAEGFGYERRTSEILIGRTVLAMPLRHVPLERLPAVGTADEGLSAFQVEA